VPHSDAFEIVIVWQENIQQYLMQCTTAFCHTVNRKT